MCDGGGEDANTRREPPTTRPAELRGYDDIPRTGTGGRVPPTHANVALPAGMMRATGTVVDELAVEATASAQSGCPVCRGVYSA